VFYRFGFEARHEDGSGCFLASPLTQLTSDSQAAVARAILATFKLVEFVSTLPGLAVGVDARAGGGASCGWWVVLGVGVGGGGG
jgi:uncharacterized membrane protein